ncbi:MAG: cytochrome c oxidase assembly protein [Alphaproteobacteria bacterium]|nr:MAG: cytochrome c oxidase assembly protein [Alphaproteobacteria bacterium]
MNQRQNTKTLILLLSLVLAMIGLSFAAVPLYRIFCQQTGYGGTTQVATTFAKEIKNRRFIIRFTGTVNGSLPWKFQPLQKEISIRAGESAFAVYHVVNTSDQPVVGMATYNVTPDKAGGYFNKVECFCFLEQRLEPHQSVDMPLLFYIDPEITEDPSMNDVETITLSYTFFKFKGIPSQHVKGVQTHRLMPAPT